MIVCEFTDDELEVFHVLIDHLDFTNAHWTNF